MSAVFPGPGLRGHERADWLDNDPSSPTVIHHVLDGLAGFHGTEMDALTSVRLLADSHGVRADQMVLLGPHDAAWLRFMRLARQWNRRPHGQGGTSVRSVGTVMLLAATATALLVAAVLRQDEFLGFALELMTIGTAAVFGATIAAGLVVLLHRQQPQFKDFDRIVRHQLAHGCWAVLVHDLPWSRQAGVVELVHRRSTTWYAVSSARQSSS